MTRRAVLFANGEMPDLSRILAMLKADDYLVAVDGGLQHLHNLKKTPHLLIGDLDSVSADEVSQAEAQGVEIRRFKIDKDETDLELALATAAEKGFDEILLVAALGGRLDQTLANLYLLMVPELAKARVTIESGREEIFIIRDHVEIHGTPGDIVSLIPLVGETKGVETRSLKYPLRKETLLPERTRGISNVMLTDLAGVTIESGCLLCIHTRTKNMEEK